MILGFSHKKFYAGFFLIFTFNANNGFGEQVAQVVLPRSVGNNKRRISLIIGDWVTAIKGENFSLIFKAVIFILPLRIIN